MKGQQHYCASPGMFGDVRLFLTKEAIQRRTGQDIACTRKKAENNPRHPVTDLRNHLDNHRVQSKDVSVGRRIVTESGFGIKHCWPDPCHCAAPAAEAIYIHHVSCHEIADNHPGSHRSAESGQKHAFGKASVSACLFIFPDLHHGHRGNQGVCEDDQDQPRPCRRCVALFCVLVITEDGDLLLFIPKVGNFIPRYELDLFQPQVVKPGLSCTFPAVSANPGEQRHAALILAGFTVPFEELPLAIRVVQAFAEDIQALDGEIGATAFFDILRPDVTAETVKTFRFNLDPLGKSGVVLPDVPDAGGPVPVFCVTVRDGKNSVSFVPVIRVLNPSDGMTFTVDLFKASVGQLVFGLTEAEQTQHQDKQQKAPQGKIPTSLQ